MRRRDERAPAHPFRAPRCDSRARSQRNASQRNAGAARDALDVAVEDAQRSRSWFDAASLLPAALATDDATIEANVAIFTSASAVLTKACGARDESQKLLLLEDRCVVAPRAAVVVPPHSRRPLRALWLSTARSGSIPWPCFEAPLPASLLCACVCRKRAGRRKVGRQSCHHVSKY